MAACKFFLLFIAMAAILLTSESFHFEAPRRSLKPSRAAGVGSSSGSPLYMSDPDNAPKMQDPITIDPVIEPLVPGSDADDNTVPGKRSRDIGAPSTPCYLFLHTSFD